MAKIKNLKKDVNFLTSELITQTFFMQYMHPELKSESLTKIIEKGVELRNKTMKDINNPKPDEKPKAFYNELTKNYVKEIFKLFDDLNKLKK